MPYLGDYLGHLLIPANLAKLKSGLARWRVKSRDASVVSKVPTEFLPVEIDPQGRDAVQVATSFRVDQEAALGTIDDDLVLRLLVVDDRMCAEGEGCFPDG